MSLPRFFSRVGDSITPLLVGAGDSASLDVGEFLASKSIVLRGPEDLDRHQNHRAGFALLANLCARLYPTIRIIAPSAVVAQCCDLILQINPDCDVSGETDIQPAAGTVCWSTPTEARNAVAVGPDGWDVVVDENEFSCATETNMLCALAAGAIAASELFRIVFAEFLRTGRTARSPGRFNLLTHPGAPQPDCALPPDIPLSRIHLVGAGAVGQAMIYALARVSATGTIVVVDPETITLSNLQRYVLTGDKDVDVAKGVLVARELAPSKIECTSVEQSWSIESAELSRAEVICSAVDTSDSRIALQSALPMRLYNAWTQPSDIGWSRHEEFGVEPCAACLYWPTGPRPSLHELVAKAIRQNELRALAYLTSKIPVDQPLAPMQIPQLSQLPLPVEAALWSSVPLLDDIAKALGVNNDNLSAWRGRLLGDLYREGICGGALIRSQHSVVPAEMAVPLAHQSALAGIMLATQLIVAVTPQLISFRSAAIESRLDLLAGMPQVAPRPRQRTPGCMCDDRDFVDRYRRKWPYRTGG